MKRSVLIAVAVLVVLVFAYKMRRDADRAPPPAADVATPGAPGAASPVPSRVPESGAVESSPSDGDVGEIIARARGALPKRSTLKIANAEAAHGTPPEVLAAGRALGDLAQHLVDHPEDVRRALPFYAECAIDGEGLPAVRALCYGNLRRHRPAWEAEIARAAERVPNDIRDLWKNLED